MIALTLKEKRHYEVCLERVFTRIAGVGLGDEAYCSVVLDIDNSLTQNTYAELIPAKKNCSCITK